MFRRLHVQIWLGFLAVAVFCVVVAGLAGRLAREGAPGGRVPPAARGLAELLTADLPEGAELPAALAARAEALDLSLSLWAGDGTPLGQGGAPLPFPDQEGWFHDPVVTGLAVRLADGRWLAAAVVPLHDPVAHTRFLVVLAVLVAAMAAGTWPLARRITRRLEALQVGVERVGRGELGARVEVRGGDEVAALARSFNEAAERIEALVEAQRRTLASASHDLRSPLARLRVALDLLGGADPATAAEAARDIAELDELIGDLLLASRLDAAPPRGEGEPLDLLGLVAEEAARRGIPAEGSPAPYQGEAALLRRMVRNLLDNAMRHGGGREVSARVEPTPEGARLVVQDRGPGVPEDLRERVFEPFFRPDGHREGDDGGVGLGLALVRRIARHHGGDATCEAREGGGSRFVVTLAGASASRRSAPPSS